MKKDVLKRLEILENDEVIEIEDISMYEREIFGDEDINTPGCRGNVGDGGWRQTVGSPETGETAAGLAAVPQCKDRLPAVIGSGCFGEEIRRERWRTASAAKFPEAAARKGWSIAQ